MKINRVLGIILSATTIMSSMVLPVMAEENTEISSGFEYSLKPGMEEWGQLNHGERVLASQIPEEILVQMSTDELVTTVLDYPCFIDMIFYNTYQDGFETVRDNFNGLQELLKRKDSGDCLLETYKNFNLPQILSIDNEDEKFDESLELLYLETILAQPEITETLSDENLAELENLVENNYEIQIANEDETASLL